MHPFCCNLLYCLNNAENKKLCDDMVWEIFNRCARGRKEFRRSEQKPPFTGTSTSAMKRRQRRYGICMKCGLLLLTHGLRHKMFPTRSQSDHLALVMKGPIRLFAEGQLRRESTCAETVLWEILRIRDLNIKSLKNLTLEDLNLEYEPGAQLPNLNPQIPLDDDTESDIGYDSD